MAAVLNCPAGPEAAAILLCLIGLAAWPGAVPQLTRRIVRPQVRSIREQDRALREQIMQFAKYVAADRIPTGGAGKARLSTVPDQSRPPGVFQCCAFPSTYGWLSYLATESAVRLR
jgi:hypothetical protein